MFHGRNTQCYSHRGQESAMSCVNLFRLGPSHKVSLHYKAVSSDFNVRCIYGVLHLKPARLHDVSADSGPVLSEHSV
jgi:hypothetical protein